MIACTFRVMGPGSLACYLVLASLSALSAYATAEMAWLLDLIEWISFNLTADSLQFVARGPSLRAVLWIMTIVLHGSYLGSIFKLRGPPVMTSFWKFTRVESSWDRLSVPLSATDIASAEIWACSSRLNRLVCNAARTWSSFSGRIFTCSLLLKGHVFTIPKRSQIIAGKRHMFQCATFLEGASGSTET